MPEVQKNQEWLCIMDVDNLQDSYADCMQMIEELEEEISVLQEELATEEVYSDYQLAAEKTEKINENSMKIEECMEEWEHLQEEL